MLDYEMDRPWIEMPLAFVDLETTGLSVREDRVVEIGILAVHSGEITESWASLVRPGVPIPGPASRVHGITDESVATQPSFRDLSWEVYHRLRGRLFVAYNGLGFDVPMLSAEMARCGLTLPIQPILDPMLWLLRSTGDSRGAPLSLAEACRRYGVENPRSHRVTGDCEAIVGLTIRLASRVPQHLGKLIEAQQRWEQQLQMWRTSRHGRRGGSPGDRLDRQGSLPIDASGAASREDK